jgi:hypothetical protein
MHGLQVPLLARSASAAALRTRVAPVADHAAGQEGTTRHKAAIPAVQQLCRAGMNEQHVSIHSSAAQSPSSGYPPLPMMRS